MISNDTIQTLREIVAKMGPDNVCDKPHAFAGAILDMCDANDVKLLTTVLRSHYSIRLMDYFRSGSGDAATWTQQKTFLIDESGMNEKNAESVLDALWKAMGWQRPQPSRIESEPVKEVILEAEADNDIEEGGSGRSDIDLDDLLKRVHNPPSRDKKAPRGSPRNPFKLKSNSAQARQASFLNGEKPTRKKAPAWVIKGDVLVDNEIGEYYVIDTFDDSSFLDDVLMFPGIIGAVYFGFRTANGSVAWTKYALIICILVYIIGGVIDYYLINSYEKEAMKHRE